VSALQGARERVPPAGRLTVELEQDAGLPGARGALVAYDSAELAAGAAQLAALWRELGVRPGARVVVYDYGASPLAFLAAAAFAPHLREGAAELTGASVVCVDGLPDNLTRLAQVLERFAPRLLFVRLDRVALLFSGPTALPAQLRGARLVVSADGEEPGARQLASWRREWPGGVEVLVRCDSLRQLRRTGSGARIPRSGEQALRVSPQEAPAQLAPGDDLLEWAPRSALAALARERLHQVLHRAAQLPLYRERLAGVAIAEIASFDDLAARLPRLRKGELIAAGARSGDYRCGIEACAGDPPAVFLTSGTTGRPTFAALGRRELADGSAAEVLRELRMDGMQEGMRVLAQYPAWHHLSALDNQALTWLGAEAIVPFGSFVPRYAPRLLALIERTRPEYLLTVTTMLHALIEEARERGRDLRRVFASVRYAMVAGEPVSTRERERLCEELGLEDLFERGGSSDGLWGGAECPAHRGHHVWMDHHHVEVVDPSSGAPLPAGQRGSVVVTNLSSDRSLYIRFDTEDLGELLDGECPCGREHPRVELYGRLADCVSLQERLIAPYDVRSLLDELDELIGVPLLLEHAAARERSVLRVLLDSRVRGERTRSRAQARLEAALGVHAEVDFCGPLPRRWKARATIERQPGTVQARPAPPVRSAEREEAGGGSPARTRRRLATTQKGA